MSLRKDSTEEVLKLGGDLYEDYLQKYPPPFPGYDRDDFVGGFSLYRQELSDELLRRGWTLANYDWAADDGDKAYLNELMSRPVEPLTPCNITHMDGIEPEPEDEL